MSTTHPLDRGPPASGATRTRTQTHAMIVASLLALVVAACCRPSAPPPVRFAPFGSPADVTTAAGDHDGYRITTACGRHAYGVVGLGDKPAASVDALTAIKDELAGPALRALDPDGGIGWGRACAGSGLVVTLSSWRHVDPALARFGLLVRLAGVHLEVAIRIARPINQSLDGGAE